MVTTFYNSALELLGKCESVINRSTTQGSFAGGVGPTVGRNPDSQRKHTGEEETGINQSPQGDKRGWQYVATGVLEATP